MKLMKNKKCIFIIIGIIIISVIGYCAINISTKEIKKEINCEYKTGEKDNDGFESESKVKIVFKGDKIQDLNITTNLYGEPEELDGKTNDSEGRIAFVQKYNEYQTIAGSVNIEGMNFDVNLDNNKITYVTQVKYDKLKNEDSVGLASLKNKNTEQVKHYFESGDYICK